MNYQHYNTTAANDTISLDSIPNSVLTPRYEVNSKGVFWIGVKVSKNGEAVEQDPIRLADPIHIIGSGIDNNQDYYRIAQYRDKLTHQSRTIALAAGEIGSNVGWQRLQALGIFIANGRIKREKLADYLQEQGSKTPYCVTNTAGWHDNAYILPSGDIINPLKQKIVFNGSLSYRHAYQTSGTLTDWQQHIAQYANGNSRLMLAIGAALANKQPLTA